VLGLGIAGAAELAAAAVAQPLGRWFLLFAVGASSSAIHAASGRLILGWFDAAERGLAMGIRQMGLPLGVGAAAVVLPALAVERIEPALVALGVACLASAALIWVVVRDPRREPVAPTTTGSPYRTPYLWRIHAASGLLVIPQWAIAVFAFDYLVTAQGWSITAAGALLAATQVAGALSRLVAGWWSDRARSRLGPMRMVSIVIGATMVVLVVLGLTGSALVAVALAAAAVVTTSPNGLAFTAVAERAGSRWAGRALGIQNTVQNLTATAVAPPLAVLIAAAGGGAIGYALAFATVTAFPFVAAVLIPAADESPGLA
jgi:sugar phosphate permease